MTEAGHEPMADLGDLAIDRAGEVPIGVQLAWALRARIGAARLAPGQRLPGVRELAELAAVNANTARAVYQRLEREGLIESRQGAGTFVAAAPNAESGPGDLARDVACEARERGVDPRDVAAALYVAAHAGPPSSEGLERRRALRAQIAALEQALTEIEIGNPGLLGPAPASPRMAGPRLLSAQELEHVRDRLVRRLAEAQIALDARSARAAQAADKAAAKAAAKATAKARTATATAKAPKRSPRGRAGPRPSTA